MTPKQLRDAPHWDFFEVGQFWYDTAVDVIREIVGFNTVGGFPGCLIFDHFNGGLFTWTKVRRLDNEVVSKWALLT